MSYPQIVEYNETVQDPSRAFTDPDLKAGRITETPLGLPLALSGGFALTYTVTSGSRKFAVRCFHREVPEAQTRYAAISKKLRTLSSSYFVDFDFQARGIQVRGRHYPIVKMDWAEGKTLGVYLEQASAKPHELSALRRAFLELSSFLEQNGIAHGDIQNENVIVDKGVVRLIDYDGMYVPGMQEGSGAEVGHKHFQHPGREPQHFGPNLDRFSFIILDVSIEALLADPSLHRRFREGGQAIIFKANDFADPGTSEIFSLLGQLPAVRDSAQKLAAVCAAPISDVPSLRDFIAGENIPVIHRTPQIRSGAAPSYISAYRVIDASSFDRTLRRVGDKVELVGKIVSVKEGLGKRGKGRGRPYVFINFGIWHKESVKVTIWSEGLSNMSSRPDQTWVGRWISVTGLVEPPYEGKWYGNSYRSVGITVDSESQIIHLTEEEAKFRLNNKITVAPRATESRQLSNQDILRTLSGKGHTGTSISAATRHSQRVNSGNSAAAKLSKNQRILQNIQAPPTFKSAPRAAPPSNASVSPPTRVSPPTKNVFSKVPAWVWVVGVVLLLIVYL